MDFADQLETIASRAPSQVDHITTEEAAKNAFVMPLISALGYDIFNPTEVVPEFTADVGIKKGEKVDYAIMKDGRPIMLFECKCCDVDLADVHKSQLYRYFSVTDARVGVLTNGIVYEFFSDLDDPNKMDDRPFLRVDLMNLRDSDVEELKRLTKQHYDDEEVVTAARELKYTRALVQWLAQQFTHPDEEFLTYLIAQVYSGMKTQRVREEFRPIVKSAMRLFINEQINRRLRSAMASDGESGAAPQVPAAAGAPTDAEADTEEATSEELEDGIVTTQAEIEAYMIVKAIVCNVVEPERVAIRDVKSYCGVLLDDNNRQPICRLHFNGSQWYLGLFDKQKDEDRVPIEGIDDIYDHAEQLRETVGYYDE